MGREIRQTKVAWSPQPKQELALSCPVFELFYGGAKGGGKSDFLLADFLHGINYGAPHRGILFRRTYPELEELLFRSREIYPQLGATYSETKREWTWPSGSVLKMRFLEADGDVHRYQGHQYTWIGFDELTNWASDYCYLYMFSCARSPHGIPVRVRASGNPGSVGHAWVKSRFIDNVPPMKLYYDSETNLPRVFIPATLEDNLLLSDKDPLYESRLKALEPHLYRAYRFGDWNIFAGQVFEEFRTDTHVVRPFALDPSWPRFASMDWGYQKPFSIGWWCVTGDGRMIRYREWYGSSGKANEGVKKNAKEVADSALDLGEIEGCKQLVADPACWAKQGLEGSSIADTFESCGWEMEKGNNDRLSGLSRIHDLMKVKGHDGRPMMLVFDTCRDFIRTVPLLVHDLKKIEDVNTNGEDHIYDEMRYAVMSSIGQRALMAVPRLVAADFYPDSHEDNYDALRDGLRARR